MEQLNGLDSLLVLGEIPNMPLHIGAIFIYDPSSSPSGKLEYQQVRELLGRVIDSSLPILKCRPDNLPFSIDKPYWVNDTSFNLDNHIQRFALPQPADWDELHELTGHFHAQPLNMKKPLWNALFVEGLDNLDGVPEGCTGLVLKIHHALADGNTAIKIFSALHTLSPETNAPLIGEGIENQQPDFSSPGWSRKIGRAYWHAISNPVKLTKSLIDIAPKILSKSKTRKPSSTLVPKTSLNQLSSSPDRIINHIRIPIDEMQALKKKSHCTFNDIALCIIAGALREYLSNNNELPDESLVAGMPIDIRPRDNQPAIGNQLNFANISLYTDVKDPKVRLKAIGQTTKNSKKEIERVGPKSFNSIIDNLYPGVLAWGGEKLISTGLLNKLPLINNTIVTNVPGIQVPCYLCGAQIVDYIGFGPVAPTMNLFHVVSSTHSHINISFQSCSSSLKDAESYKKSLQNSYRSLMKRYAININKAS